MHTIRMNYAFLIDLHIHVLVPHLKEHTRTVSVEDGEPSFKTLPLNMKHQDWHQTVTKGTNKHKVNIEVTRSHMRDRHMTSGGDLHVREIKV